jgi:hypothetical protein
LAAANGSFVSQSPSTSASRMKISRAAPDRPAEVDAPVAVDDQAVERGALERDHLAGLLLPMRLEQLLLQQVAADVSSQRRIDVGDAAGIEPGRLDQLGGDDPAPGFFERCEPGWRWKRMPRAPR